MTQRLARRGACLFDRASDLHGPFAGEGWIADEHGAGVGWQIDTYFHEGKRKEQWFVEGMRTNHRTIATLLDGLLDAEFRIERVVEPAPGVDRLQLRPHKREHLRSIRAVSAPGCLAEPSMGRALCRVASYCRQSCAPGFRASAEVIAGAPW
jgi:hypothetical protein